MASVVLLLLLLLGALVHARLTHADRRRAIELLMLWWVAGGGVFMLLGGIPHLGPASDETAEQIGYAQSMFQWEVGWADVAIGALGIGVIWRRDSWIEAAVGASAIYSWGNAIGHVMEWVAHDNTAPGNLGVIPADLVGPVLAIVLVIAYRRSGPARIGGSPLTRSQAPTAGTPAGPPTSGDAANRVKPRVGRHVRRAASG